MGGWENAWPIVISMTRRLGCQAKPDRRTRTPESGTQLSKLRVGPPDQATDVTTTQSHHISAFFGKAIVTEGETGSKFVVIKF